MKERSPVPSQRVQESFSKQKHPRKRQPSGEVEHKRTESKEASELDRGRVMGSWRLS